VYDLAGKLIKTIKLPDFAYVVSSISWPKRGNLLIGTDNLIRVLDSKDKEIFSHKIQNTSFDPYPSIEGTAVRFNPAQSSFLAIMCHGCPGCPRSVLLIFDPTGHLVWQEELNRLDAIIAVPEKDKREVLLVGGMDGVIEYKLANDKTSNK
jgi:hypothetical protein